ncbi:hypothetical protein PEBR_40957 [Penicillium brasilianum]|uniref:BZIP domain-containing protein n=1 Tax=Penicillium brasilianum TaxID=104259 RepID=A0A1S9R8W8_PENBI|nr:hypothetical protein PEBR_40957 [Penicillium brasilianum]
MSSESGYIPLGQMPQQAGVRTKKDDWTGIVDRTERRKLQNRLNQRAFRLRRQLKHLWREAAESRDPATQSATSTSSIELQHGFKCSIGPPEMLQVMAQLEIAASNSYRENSPNLDHLLSLPKINVQRGIFDNIRLIGMTMEWTKEDDSVSIFNAQVPGFSEFHIPLDLRPTEVQKRVPHHPWLDFFPSPTLRDNLIALQDEIDDEDLCHDLMAFWDTRNARAGLLVWGPSWQTNSWEVTESFLIKWGFLLYGCTALLKSTNFWRVQRGEKPLIWKDYFTPRNPFLQQLKRKRELCRSPLESEVNALRDRSGGFAGDVQDFHAKTVEASREHKALIEDYYTGFDKD